MAWARAQYGIRHVMLAVLAIAVMLAAAQQATRHGARGDGARLFLLFIITTAGPLAVGFRAKRRGRGAVVAATGAGLVTGAVLALCLLGTSWVSVHATGVIRARHASAEALVRSAAVLAGLLAAGSAWGAFVGLLLQLSGPLDRWRPRDRGIVSAAHYDGNAVPTRAVSEKE